MIYWSRISTQLAYINISMALKSSIGLAILTIGGRPYTLRMWWINYTSIQNTPSGVSHFPSLFLAATWIGDSMLKYAYLRHRYIITFKWYLPSIKQDRFWQKNGTSLRSSKRAPGCSGVTLQQWPGLLTGREGWHSPGSSRVPVPRLQCGPVQSAPFRRITMLQQQRYKQIIAAVEIHNPCVSARYSYRFNQRSLVDLGRAQVDPTASVSASVNLPYNQCVPAESNQGLLKRKSHHTVVTLSSLFFVLCQMMRVMTSINN